MGSSRNITAQVYGKDTDDAETVPAFLRRVAKWVAEEEGLSQEVADDEVAEMVEDLETLAKWHEQYDTVVREAQDGEEPGSGYVKQD